MLLPAVAVAALVLLCAPTPGTQAAPQINKAAVDKYTTRYDHIDVDAILKSKRLLKNYMDCVMDKGPCTREGLELRKHLPDALQTECSKCSARQKQWAGKILSHLLQHHKGYWKDFVEKYDTDGNFRKKVSFVDDDENDDEEDVEY